MSEQRPHTNDSDNAPSWVDDILKIENKPNLTKDNSGSDWADLRLGSAPQRPPESVDDWVNRHTGGAVSSPTATQGSSGFPRSTPQTDADPTPLRPHMPAAPLDPWQDAASTNRKSGDISQKKLVAGLLAIFLGGLGAHKFYLGLNTAGIIVLGGQFAVWVIAFLLGFLMFIVGLALTLPAAGAVSGAVALIGLIEGIVYLTKSDADFERDYLVNKKQWF